MVVGHIPYNIAPAFALIKLQLKLEELLSIVVQDMAWKSLANTDFMARMTTLRDSDLSCRRNSYCVAIAIMCPSENSASVRYRRFHCIVSVKQGVVYCPLFPEVFCTALNGNISGPA